MTSSLALASLNCQKTLSVYEAQPLSCDLKYIGHHATRVSNNNFVCMLLYLHDAKQLDSRIRSGGEQCLRCTWLGVVAADYFEFSV